MSYLYFWAVILRYIQAVTEVYFYIIFIFLGSDDKQFAILRQRWMNVYKIG